MDYRKLMFSFIIAANYYVKFWCKILFVDTDIVVAITFDSVIVGTDGDEIEWSARANFDEYSTINPYGSISISLMPDMDTIIWLRSNKKSTGEKSRAVHTRARAIVKVKALVARWMKQAIIVTRTNQKQKAIPKR